MVTATKMGVVLLAFCSVLAASAADLGRPEAVPLARAGLSKETSANMRAVAVGVLGRHGEPERIGYPRRKVGSIDGWEQRQVGAQRADHDG